MTILNKKHQYVITNPPYRSGKKAKGDDMIFYNESERREYDFLQRKKADRAQKVF